MITSRQLARIMVSLAVANDLELYSVDIEQAFTQADKLPEGVNGRYFINPPTGSPDTGNKDVVYSSSQELCTKRWMHFSRVRVLTLLVLKDGYEGDQQVASIRIISGVITSRSFSHSLEVCDRHGCF